MAGHASPGDEEGIVYEEHDDPREYIASLPSAEPAVIGPAPDPLAWNY